MPHHHHGTILSTGSRPILQERDQRAQRASFGIKVTIVEPGSYSTGFRHATETAPGMPEYADLRKAVHGSFDADMVGDPKATAAVILQLVDMEAPPLRFILGDWLLPMFKKFYQERIETWEKWADLSSAAQGREHS